MKLVCFHPLLICSILVLASPVVGTEACNPSVGASDRSQTLIQVQSSVNGRKRVIHKPVHAHQARAPLPEHSETLLPLELICDHFELDDKACDRVQTYLGENLSSTRSLLQVRVAVAPQNLLVDFGGEENLVRDKCSVFFVPHEMQTRADPSSGCYANFFGKIDTRKLKGNLAGGEMGQWLHDMRKTACQAGSSILELGQNFTSGRGIMIHMGDFTYDGGLAYPTATLSRTVDRSIDRSKNHVLFNFLRDRFWHDALKVYHLDAPHSVKTNKLAWRGTPAGPPCWNENKYQDESTQRLHNHTLLLNTRMLLVHKYFNTSDDRIDIGLTNVPFNDWCENLHLPFLKDSKTLRSMLENKFVLVVEGNNIATGTHWALASNSVPFMVPPRWETWLLEGRLKPWIHFVPLSPNFSDIPEKINWAMEHPVECEQIAAAGREYFREFTDLDREDRIQQALYMAYQDRVDVRMSSGRDYSKTMLCEQPSM